MGGSVEVLPEARGGLMRLPNEMEALGPFKGVYRDITPIMENQMEKNMEHEMETLGSFKGVYRDITPIMENQMEKNMENEMDIGIIG